MKNIFGIYSKLQVSLGLRMQAVEKIFLLVATSHTTAFLTSFRVQKIAVLKINPIIQETTIGMLTLLVSCIDFRFILLITIRIKNISISY